MKDKDNDKKVVFPKINNEFPEIPISTELVTKIRTGDWRDSRPVYKEKIAPCNYNCPAGEDIRGYISLLKEGNYKRALELILESNPLPSVCGRVCFHPCEQSCNRKELDEPISIHAIERFLSDYGANNLLKPPEISRNGKKVAVIGSGPSGLSCAYHLTRMGYLVTVFEKLPFVGGILRIGIPEYRLPKMVLDRDLKYIIDCGVEIKANVNVGKDLSFKKLIEEEYDAIFIGIGAQLDKKLGISEEDAEGIISGLYFLKQLNFKIPDSIGPKVAVIGGGNTAIDCARSARRLGAKSVKVIYRRSRNEMPAIASEISEAGQEGIEFIYLTSPVKVFRRNGKISKLECIQMKLGASDESGRRKPIPIQGSSFFIKVDSVITALGANVDWSTLPKSIEVANDLIRINSDGLTNQLKVYAGGDAVDQPRTVVHAIGAGKRAAFAIDRDLQKNKEIYRQQSYEVVGFDEINPYYFQTGKQVKELFLLPEKRFSNFEEVNKGFSEQMAIQEANRCFNCGLCTECNTCLIFCPDIAISKSVANYEINYDYCKGCGVCVEECPRGVLSMEIEKRSDF
jgi:NADPH-dependent glutamate synthase beta subunit-like oxidoreductase